MSVPSSPRIRKKHRPNPRLTRAEIGEVVRIYRDGTSSVEIAREFRRRGRSVTKQGIIFHLRREGVTMRKSQPWRKLEPGEVRHGRRGVKEPQPRNQIAFELLQQATSYKNEVDGAQRSPNLAAASSCN